MHIQLLDSGYSASTSIKLRCIDRFEPQELIGSAPHGVDTTLLKRNPGSGDN